MIVVDTDVLVDALAGREPAASRIALELRSGGLATTSITTFELVSGAKKKRHRKAIARLLAGVTILPVDERAAIEASTAHRRLEKAGEDVRTADLLVAGVCLAQSGVLLTKHADRFRRIPGLVVSQLHGGSGSPEATP